MSKYQLVLRCKSCQHRYKRIVVAEAEEELSSIPNPPCPKCAKKPKRTDSYEVATPAIPHEGMDDIVRTGHAPGIIGANTTVRAIDETARIVMEDHKLSNLQDNVRMGDTVAPKLPPAQQKAADSFFGNSQKDMLGKSKQQTLASQRQQSILKRMGQKAIAGAYRTTAADVKGILPDSRVALHRSGVEQLRRQ